eukprot:763311-Hanusia_phi.AAC.2
MNVPKVSCVLSSASPPHGRSCMAISSTCADHMSGRQNYVPWSIQRTRLGEERCLRADIPGSLLPHTGSSPQAGDLYLPHGLQPCSGTSGC